MIKKLNKSFNNFSIYTEDVIKLYSFVYERKGEREEMQDTHVNIDNFSLKVDNLHPTM